MPTTGAPFNIYYPALTDTIDDLDTIFTTLATSIANGMPVQFPSTLAQLNSWGASGTYPAGQLAVLTTADSGLDEAAQFTQSASNLWYLTGNAHFTNLATFITALGTYTTLRTRPGATFYDDATTVAGIWTNTTGSYVIINNAKQVSGYVSKTTTAGAVNSWAVTFPAGMFPAGTVPKVFVNMNNAQGGTGKFIFRAYNITNTGFRIGLWNGDNTTIRGGLSVYWQWFAVA